MLGFGDLHGWHEIDSACGGSLSWFRISSHLRSLMEHWWQLNLHLLGVFFHNGSYVAPNWFSKRFAGWRLPILPRFSTHLRHSEKASWVNVATFRVESLLQTFWQTFHVANFIFFFSVWVGKWFGKFKIQQLLLWCVASCLSLRGNTPLISHLSRWNQVNQGQGPES